ncbi:MAG: glycosyltransferase family 4 protein [bacterium]|nr:glycosyltransferase family 4 protein [bacterium]
MPNSIHRLDSKNHSRTFFHMQWIIDGRSLVSDLHGGVSRVGVSLCDALIRHAEPTVQITCVTTGWRQHSLQTETLNRSHLHLSIPNKIWSANALSRFASLTESTERRVGKCHAVFFPNIGFTGRITLPYTLLLHDLSFLIEPKWFSKKMRVWHHAVHAEKMIKNATHLFSVSETTKQDAIRLLKIPEDRITVIPIGPTFSRPSLSHVHASDKNRSVISHERDYSIPYYFPYVLALGSGDPRKNTSLAIETVRTLRKMDQFRDLHLVLLGSPQRPIEPWIIYEENVDDERMQSLYGSARAFLYPSWYEGYGLPLHEAHALGVPSISSNGGALSETAPPSTRFADPAKLHHWVEELVHLISTSNAIVSPSSPTNSAVSPVISSPNSVISSPNSVISSPNSVISSSNSVISSSNSVISSPNSVISSEVERSLIKETALEKGSLHVGRDDGSNFKKGSLHVGRDDEIGGDLFNQTNTSNEKNSAWDTTALIIFQKLREISLLTD